MFSHARVSQQVWLEGGLLNVPELDQLAHILRAYEIQPSECSVRTTHVDTSSSVIPSKRTKQCHTI